MKYAPIKFNEETIKLYDYQKDMLKWFKDESIKKFTCMPLRTGSKRIRPKEEDDA